MYALEPHLLEGRHSDAIITVKEDGLVAPKKRRGETFWLSGNGDVIGIIDGFAIHWETRTYLYKCKEFDMSDRSMELSEESFDDNYAMTTEPMG